MAAAPLWTGAKVAAIVGGRWQPGQAGAGPIGDVAYLAHEARPGCLVFIADDTWDPTFARTHGRLAQLARAGPAALVVAARLLDGVPALTCPVLVVDDTGAALRALAAAARDRFAGAVVAVTGTAGKTSTVRMLAHVLRPLGSTATTTGNLNFGPGLWTALARTRPGARYAVYELGMLGPGTIAPKSQLVRPDVAVVTALDLAHLQYHGDIASIVETKAGIIDGLPPHGTLVAPRESPWFDTLAARATERGIGRILSYGAHPAADVGLVAATIEATGSTFTAAIAGREVAVALATPGRHVVDNALAVLGAVQALGADVARAGAALGDWQPPRGRGRIERVETPGGIVRLIDHSFNANPRSMAAAFDVLGLVAPGPGGRRIAVLADMAKLGPQSAALHRDLAAPLLRVGVDRVLTVGTEIAALRQALPADRLGPHAADLEDLEAALAATLRGGDVVLLKGSLATRIGEVAQRLRAGMRFSTLLLDLPAGAVLAEHAADVPRPAASLAKLMTLYLVFKALDDGRLGLRTRIVVSAAVARPVPGSARLGCAAGEVIGVEDIVRGLIVASANDAAAAIAERLGGGSEATFVDLMNATAAAMGLARTRFASAAGLDGGASCTTAREIATLARHVIEDFPHRLGWFAETGFAFRGRWLPARNRLLSRYDGLIGLKTGHLPVAGWHLVALAQRGPRRLLSVVLGAASEDARDARTVRLLDHGFAATG